MLQSALHAAPDNLRLGELVCYALSEVPGISSAAIYIDGRLVSHAETSRHQLPNWPSRWQDTPQFLPPDPNRFVALPLQTNKTNYGFLALLLTGQQEFQGYLPYLENTVNLIALMLENRQQSAELRELNEDLEAQVKDRVKSLQLSEERLSLALVAANSGLWDWNLKTGELFFDANYFKMAGYDQNEFPHTYDEWKKRVHPDDIAQIETQIEDYLSGRSRQFGCEFRFKTKHGQWMWILGQGLISERDEDGAPIRFIGTQKDIDERKQAEGELLRNQYYLKKAQQIGKIGTWELNILNNELVWTDENCHIFGIPTGCFVDYKLFLDKIHPDDLEYVGREWQAAMQGKPYDIEHRIVVAGETKWVREKADVTFDAKGHAIKAIGFTQDITERQQAEQALQKAFAQAEEAREKLETILKSVADGLIFTNMESLILLMSASTEMLLGKKSSELLLQPLDAAIDDKDIVEYIQKVMASGENEMTMELELSGQPQGQGKTLQIKSSLVLGQAGRKEGVITLLRDVSRERELDRMKSEFISTAAHELRTPLTSVLGYSQLLLSEQTFDAEQQADFLAIINEKAEVLEKIIDDLLNVRRVESGQILYLQKERQNLVPALEKIVNQYQQVYKTHHFEISFPEYPVEIMVDPVKFTQIMENILFNAVKFSPTGSLVLVCCEISVSMLMVSVKDQGCGMTPEQAKRVFDKFYRVDSTNAAKEGLGLGMSIVKGIVEAHGGTIWVESELGKGTLVKFTLPMGQ